MILAPLHVHRKLPQLGELVPRRKADGSAALQLLAAFLTNPAGATILNATVPIRQIVQNGDASLRRYLVIAPGDAADLGEAVQIELP